MTMPSRVERSSVQYSIVEDDDRATILRYQGLLRKGAGDEGAPYLSMGGAFETAGPSGVHGGFIGVTGGCWGLMVL